MAFDPLRPFNTLPDLPPRCEIESKAVLKQCLAATRALAELKGAGDLIPNQAILINAIPLQEARLSSEIENIVTTQDKLFSAALDDGARADPQTKEVLRYRVALRQAAEALQARPFGIDLAEEVCASLLGKAMPARTDEVVHIGNPDLGEVMYTPPAGGTVVKEKLRNLEKFLLGAVDLDPIVRMAVGHYQFEAIHPFSDGNGRTGRILNIVFLLHAGLLQIPVLYLSRFIIQNKSDYYNRLLQVTREQEWEPWILFMLRAIEETALWTTGRVHSIRDLFDSTVELCRDVLPARVYSKELIELIFVQPYCRIQDVVNAGLAKRQTAADYLRALEDVSVLVGEKRGREVLFRHPALLEALTA